MLLLVVCAVIVLSPLAVGTWPAGLVNHRWRAVRLLWVTFAVQFLALEVDLPGLLAPALHVASYVAALAFVWANRTLAGLVVLGAGAACNGITIALNGGVLPATAHAVALTGADRGDGFANSAVLEHPTLWFLGDVFAVPAPLPLANTFSVGDVLIVAGFAIAVWTGRRPLPRRSR